jgi:chromosomal replication initiation ATPase DnaA
MITQRQKEEIDKVISNTKIKLSVIARKPVRIYYELVEPTHETHEISEVIQMFCDVMEVPKFKLISPSRKTEITNCREMVAQYLFSEMHIHPKKIGQILKRDRTSILHTLDMFQIHYKHEWDYKLSYDRTKSLIQHIYVTETKNTETSDPQTIYAGQNA